MEKGGRGDREAEGAHHHGVKVIHDDVALRLDDEGQRYGTVFWRLPLCPHIIAHNRGEPGKPRCFLPLPA